MMKRAQMTPAPEEGPNPELPKLSLDPNPNQAGGLQQLWVKFQDIFTRENWTLEGSTLWNTTSARLDPNPPPITSIRIPHSDKRRANRFRRCCDKE